MKLWRNFVKLSITFENVMILKCNNGHKRALNIRWGGEGVRTPRTPPPPLSPQGTPLEVKMYISLFLFHDWFPLEFVFTYNIFSDVMRNKLQTISIYTKVNKKKIKNSRKEYVMWTCFKFWPMKNYKPNYKPIRVWLWLVYKFTENYCCL